MTPPLDTRAAMRSTARYAGFAALTIVLAGLYAYRVSSTSHYGPDSDVWASFVEACAARCRQAGKTEEVCARLCDCSANKIFTTSPKSAVDQASAALHENGSAAEDVRRRVEALTKECAAGEG